MYLDEGKKIIKRYVDEGLLPGAVFAYVTKDDCEKDCYGYKALLPEKEALTMDTLYDLASLSKVIGTAPMIFKLTEEGLISMKMKVSSILEDFPYKDITVEDLMTHTSGIAADDKNYKKCKDPEELWDFVMKEVEWPCKRKEKVIYSCFGFIILGKIIEHYKKDIPSYFEDVIASPLGTSDLFYRPEDHGRMKDCAPTEVTEARGIIQGEVHDGKAHILNGRAGNAGVFSDIDGLYDHDPRLYPQAKLIEQIDEITEETFRLAGGAGSRRGTGGMRTKLQAAQLATAQKIDVNIINGQHPEALYDIVEGKPAGTLFTAKR